MSSICTFICIYVYISHSKTNWRLSKPFQYRCPDQNSNYNYNIWKPIHRSHNHITNTCLAYDANLKGLKTQWLIKRISYSFYFCLSFSSKKFRHPLFQGAITPAAWLFCEQKRSEQVTVSLVLVNYERTRLDTRHITITDNSKQVKSVKILTFFSKLFKPQIL